MTRPVYNLLLVFSLTFCSAQQPTETNPLWETLSKLTDYDSLEKAEVMVLGVFHFDQKVLGKDSQISINRLIDQIAEYGPTKVIVEWEPELTKIANAQYQKYLKGNFKISEKPNEVYQLGFRLAKKMGHDKLYLFDDQTEFIGSLAAFSTNDDPFSFSRFTAYADTEDDGFYNVFEDILISNFETNQKLMESLSLDQHIGLLNSPKHQRNNAKRMHMYELRVGIQKNWAGPDWLGRWYRRNTRMLANVLKIMEKGDKLLIIVGDNHKWTLDMLFENTPDFKLVSSWDLWK